VDLAQGGGGELSFEMLPQLLQRPEPDISVARPRQFLGCLPQRINHAPVRWLLEAGTHQTHDGPRFLDVLARAMHRFGVVTFLQAFQRVFDPLKPQASAGFCD
jgi:hypothetical protein